MSRLSAAMGSIVFLLLAPGIVVGVIPWLITRWRLGEAVSPISGARRLGFVLIGVGLVILIETFGRFAFEGLGTPAPILPTRHLVVRGSYGYVRNPMYVALLCIIYGQAVVLLDWRLAVYGVIVWLCSHLFIRVYEEPTLRGTYGEEYVAYCANVPRWLPHWRNRRRLEDAPR